METNFINIKALILIPNIIQITAFMKVFLHLKLHVVDQAA